VWEVSYLQSQNEQAKQLLYQYTGQDFEYDKELWRKHILLPLQKRAREPHRQQD
jgi:hypothetical protein